MTNRQFITQNLRRYKRYYMLIALAVVLANTIITGSLFVGDSVRQTLVNRVDERLGRTVSLVASGNRFIEETFADAISTTAPFSILNSPFSIIFLTNGFLSHGLSLLPVSVWGVDSSMTAIAGQDFIFPDVGEAVINRKTANELSLKEGDVLVIRLPNTSMIPSGSLFVTDNYTASLRLKVKAVIDSRQSGNLNLRNEQSLPFNLFINRRELTNELDMEGKCNILMSNSVITNEQLSEAWKPAFSGIKAEQQIQRNSFDKKEVYHEVVSESVFLEKDLIDRLDERFPNSNHLFSYLVNDILNSQFSTLNSQFSIPYSFVTAIDHFNGYQLSGNDIILSDYSAKRLSASIGDTVSLAYYVSAELKALREEKRSFVVKKILPIETFQVDGRLSAEFPGLHDVDNCTDWDSDIPIDMERITKEDEDYWDNYRTTPKALIAYTEGARMWSNNYGAATAVRIYDEENIDLSDVLSPADAGITIISPRETGLAAARGGVDFKSLFLSLSFFVFASALLLATVPLGGMLRDRRKELLLLQALGYNQKRIKKMLLDELAVMVVVATIIGMITAVLYNRLTLFALGNIWKGAVHTENFISNIEPVSLIIGATVSLTICFITIMITLQKIFKVSNLKSQSSNLKFQSSKFKLLFVTVLVLMLLLIVINIFIDKSPLLFMATGFIALLASIMGYAFIIQSKSSKATFNRNAVFYKNLNYRRRNGVISVAVLASGLFVVFAVGLNRKSFSDVAALMSGTGGFTLWGENSVPLYHSLSTVEGRSRFGLSELPEETSILQFYRHSGDDASCLNLNKAPQPTVLGVDATILSNASFTFAMTHSSINDNHSSNIWNALTQKIDNYYPVIADQTVLQWGLMKSVGDTIMYHNRKGEPVVLQFIGGLNNSIFQGNLLIDKRFFAEIWGEDGSEIMLIQTPYSSRHDVKQTLSQALANYGLQLTFCNERLKEFNSVTDSYLTIFLMFGGLGLLIGLFGMLLIIRRGLLDRVGERTTLFAIGFDEKSIKEQLFRESMIAPLYALAAGTVASLVAVASALTAVNNLTWAIMLAILLLLVIIAWIYTKKITNYELRIMKGANIN